MVRQKGIQKFIFAGGGTSTIDVSFTNLYGNATWILNFLGANPAGEFPLILEVQYYGNSNPQLIPFTPVLGDLIYKDDFSGDFNFVLTELNGINTDYSLFNSIDNKTFAIRLPVATSNLVRLIFAAPASYSAVTLSLSGT